MLVNTDYLSSHFDNREMDISFLILHYTACSLEETLNIFLNSSSKVSAHFIINTDGKVYNCVPINKCAWHAGESRFCDDDGQEWKNFNDFSIGVELINLNGNLFPYTHLQYESLFTLIKQLQNKQPKLKDPKKILGHEHIAGFRGKADPGYYFDWKKLFNNCYKNMLPPSRVPIISEILLKKYQEQLLLKKNHMNFKKLNLSLEKEIAL